MKQAAFEDFVDVIKDLPDASISDRGVLDPRLLLRQEGELQVYYAPFDYVNATARVVLVGLTPGRTQMVNALKEAKRQLLAGVLPKDALRAAKKVASFSGAMRPNLVALLDDIGLQAWLAIKSCSELFDRSSHLVHTTSVLRFPVFVSDKNYSGTPDPIANRLLKGQVLEHFAGEARQLRNAVFVPVGEKAAKVLQYLASERVIDKGRIFDGVPHPSGANAERIAYFLGRKPRERLSAKTDAAKLDAAKRDLLKKVAVLPAVG